MKQLNCEQAKELLQQDIDGEISTEDKALLAEHLNSCENCQNEYEQLKAVSSYLSELAIEVPTELHESVMAEIGKEKKTRARFMRRIRVLTGAAAAAVVCVAILHTPLLDLPMLSKTANEVADMSPSEEADLSTKKDFNYSADLPEGSLGSLGSVTGGEEADGAMPEIYLPGKDDADVTVQKGYRIEGTPYLVWLRDGETAIVCYDSGDGKTELILSVSYTLEQNVLRITDGDKYLLFDIDGSTAKPTEGTLLDDVIQK